jgi:hypothetical protein
MKAAEKPKESHGGKGAGSGRPPNLTKGKKQINSKELTGIRDDGLRFIDLLIMPSQRHSLVLITPTNQLLLATLQLLVAALLVMALLLGLHSLMLYLGLWGLLFMLGPTMPQLL